MIAHTWDAVSLGADEQVQLLLRGDRAGNLEIQVDAPFWNDPRPPAAPGPCDRLWEFETVEIFIAAQVDADAPVPYTEIELSPHGHYLALRFLGTRNAVDRALTLDYQAVIADTRWTGLARVPAELLPPLPWRANAFGLHGVGDNRRYLASTPMPGALPDFHRPELFPALLGGC